MTIAGDLRTLEGASRSSIEVNARFKRCDVLVNNAGATKGGKFADQPDADWIDGFALKFFGAVRLTRLFWPLPDKKRTATSSISSARRAHARTGIRRRRGQRRVRQFFQRPRADGQQRRHQHQRHSSRPRRRPTGSKCCSRSSAKAQDKTIEQVRAEAVSKSGIRRIAQPEDVAELALFSRQRQGAPYPGRRHRRDGGSTLGFY